MIAVRKFGIVVVKSSNIQLPSVWVWPFVAIPSCPMGLPHILPDPMDTSSLEEHAAR